MISLIGDIAFTGLLSYDFGKNEERFQNVSPLLNEQDLVIANFEAPVKVSEEQNEYKNFIHYSLKEPSKQLLKKLNIGCVSLANNHIYDCKMDGLEATINLLDDLNIAHTGAGWKKEHIEPVIIEYNEKKIGFLAYVDKKTNPKTEKFPELLINYIDENIIILKIKELKKKVDKVILSLHWGVDYSFYPIPKQREMAKLFVDAGADIIMGHHAHTIQPYEKYKNSYIMYSLGGLTFGDYKKSLNSPVLSLFKKTKKGLISHYDYKNNNLTFTSTLELQGNFIEISKMNFKKWSNKMWFYYKIKNFNHLLKKIFIFKEKVLDRVYEYFFGYYQNPIKRLFQFSNIKKIHKLFK